MKEKKNSDWWNERRPPKVTNHIACNCSFFYHTQPTPHQYTIEPVFPFIWQLNSRTNHQEGATKTKNHLFLPFFFLKPWVSTKIVHPNLKILALHALSNHPLDLLGEEQSRKKWFWVAWAKETGGWGANIRRVHLDQKQPNKFEVWTLGAQFVSWIGI